jgi:predicted nucleic acid-binding protein
MTTLVVDTDLVSFIFNRHPLGEAYLDMVAGKELVVSFMTLAEVRLGARLAQWGSRRMERQEHCLSRYRVAYPDSATRTCGVDAVSAARRRGRPLSVQDACIAATALRLGAPLGTHNARDYEGLADLKVLTHSPSGAS